MGLLRGLVSNCSSWDRDLWPSCELAPHFDVPVLCPVVGLMKSEPRIFKVACKRLGAQPEECLHVGDGGSTEFTAAKEAGRHPVLIRAPYHDGPAGNEVREGEFWTWSRISPIPEIVGLLE